MKASNWRTDTTSKLKNKPKLKLAQILYDGNKANWKNYWEEVAIKVAELLT